jgi:hypothetical protein
MLNVKKLCTILYIKTNFSCYFCTILYIGNNYSCFTLNLFLNANANKFLGGGSRHANL